jgi:hypothetical protein
LPRDFLGGFKSKMEPLSKETVSSGDIYIFATSGPRGNAMMIPSEVTRVDDYGFFYRTDLRAEEDYQPFFGFDLNIGILIKRASLKGDILDCISGDDFFCECLAKLKKYN